MTNNQQDLSYIKDFLLEHIQMSVSTVGEFIWIFTAYYAIDKDLNIFFSRVRPRSMVNNLSLIQT